VGFELAASGFYPVEVSPSWVPPALPALLTADHTDPVGEPLTVTGTDGVGRPAEEAGRLVLVPGMPDDSALVDLDAVTRGAAITRDTHIEIWMDASTELVSSVRAALAERDITTTDIRRYTDIRKSYDDSVSSWSLALGAAVAPAVMLLALLVLLVLALIGWRTRARDLAVLRLNGVGRRTTRRLAVWAQLPAVLVAVVGGVLAGLGGAALAMPDVALLPAPPEVPVVDVATSWPAVLAATAVCLVVLPAAAVLTGLVVARRAHVERVREGA
jgi:putative ABC transport system permease protein